MLNQFPRNFRHVSRLPWEDVPIFLEEFDEREFLFGIQIVAYVSNLRRFLRGQHNHLAECVLQLDGRLGLGHDRVWEGLSQGLLELLELCRHRQSVSCLTTLFVTVKSPFDISPDGDDATWPWHLQDQIGIMWDCHEFGECRSSQESVVHSLDISDLKLYSFRTENFPSPAGYEKRHLTDGGCCCTRYYTMERSPTGA
jgi:hypothetical protein